MDLTNVWWHFPWSARWDEAVDRLISHLWRRPSCKDHDRRRNMTIFFQDSESSSEWRSSPSEINRDRRQNDNNPFCCTITINVRLTMISIWSKNYDLRYLTQLRQTHVEEFLLDRSMCLKDFLSTVQKDENLQLLSSHLVWSSSRQIDVVTLRISLSLPKMSLHSVCSHDVTCPRRMQRLTRRPPLSWEAPLLQTSHGTADVCPDRSGPVNARDSKSDPRNPTDRSRSPQAQREKNCAVASRLRATPPLTAGNLASETREQSVRSRNSLSWTWKLYALIRNHFFEEVKKNIRPHWSAQTRSSRHLTHNLRPVWKQSSPSVDKSAYS